MSAQSLESYNREGTGGSAWRRTFAREEYALLAAAKRGDSAAFEILCKQSADAVFHLARRITRSNEDAEDVVRVAVPHCHEALEMNTNHGNFRWRGKDSSVSWVKESAVE